MTQPKIYTTFGFFKAAAAITGIAVLVLFLLAMTGRPALLLPGLSLLALAFVVLGFRIVQLIYKMQLDRVHDVNQVESLLWLYQQFQPQVAFPPMRIIAGSPDFFKVIIENCQNHRPGVIVEAGSGVSSVVISEWLRATGGAADHYALDHLQQYAEETARKVEYANSRVLYAPLRSHAIDGRSWQWYDISELDEVQAIDLLIIDGPPEDIQRQARYPALPLLWEKLSDRAVIILDDTNRPDERAVIRKWCARYNLQEQYWYTEKGTTVLTRK